MSEDVTTVIVREEPTYVMVQTESAPEVVEVPVESVQVISVAEGPRGRPGPAGDSAEGYTAENVDSVELFPGMALAPHPSTAGVRKASSADSTLRPVIGLVRTGGDPGDQIVVQLSGPLTLSDWSGALASGNTQLARKTEYFVNGQGKLTPIAPVGSAGEAIVSAGTSLSTDTLAVEIDHRGIA